MKGLPATVDCPIDHAAVIAEQEPPDGGHQGNQNDKNKIRRTFSDVMETPPLFLNADVLLINNSL